MTIVSPSEEYWKLFQCNCGNIKIKGGTGYIYHWIEDKNYYKDLSQLCDYTYQEALEEINDLIFDKKYNRHYSSNYYDKRISDLAEYIKKKFNPSFSHGYLDLKHKANQ